MKYITRLKPHINKLQKFINKIDKINLQFLDMLYYQLYNKNKQEESFKIKE